MIKKIILILFLLSIFCLALSQVKDPDFGWHYRCGNQFLQTGKLCLTNEFSYFLPHYQSYETGHLYDIFLAFIYNHAGFLGVSMTAASLLAGIAYFFVKLFRNHVLGFLSFFLMFILSYNVFYLGLRSQIFSVFFLVITLCILEKYKSKLLYLFPFIFFLWTNTHIGFFIGLMVLFFYGLGKKLLFTRRFLAVGILSFFATLINPYGIYAYVEIYRHALSPLGTMIAEWVAPSFAMQVFISLLVVAGIFWKLRQKSFNLYHTLLVVVFGIFALKAQRNLPLFFISYFYILLSDVKIKIGQFEQVLLPLSIALSVFAFVIKVPAAFSQLYSWTDYCEGITVSYPCKAIGNFPQLHGNVYALYEWGGFLDWQKPGIKVFADGRMPAWHDENGKSPYQVYLDIIQTKPGWNEKLRSLKTNYIFITDGTFLDLLLQKSASRYGWKQVYRDNLAVIYKNTI